MGGGTLCCNLVFYCLPGWHVCKGKFNTKPLIIIRLGSGLSLEQTEEALLAAVFVDFFFEKVDKR